MPVNVNATLQKALAELQAERGRIDRQIAAIHAVLGAGRGRAGRASGRPAAGRRARKRMSAAQRRAVSRRMKAYWAKRKAAGKGKGGGKK